jgi:hypothetical protein
MRASMMPSIKALLAGSAAGLLAFVTFGWIIYAILWHSAGMDRVKPEDNPAVVAGAFWCFRWGLVSATIAGLTAMIVISRWVWLRTTAAGSSSG